MDYRFFSQDRTHHRRRLPGRESGFGRGCEAGDGGGVLGAGIAVAGIGHARIAGRLLVAPQRPPAEPRQRIEPVQREQGLRGEIGEDVVRAVVRQLVRYGEVACGAVLHQQETGRQRDDLVEQAEGERRSDRTRFDEADVAHLAHG